MLLGSELGLRTVVSAHAGTRYRQAVGEDLEHDIRARGFGIEAHEVPSPLHCGTADRPNAPLWYNDIPSMPKGTTRVSHTGPGTFSMGCIRSAEKQRA